MSPGGGTLGPYHFFELLGHDVISNIPDSESGFSSAILDDPTISIFPASHQGEGIRLLPEKKSRSIREPGAKTSSVINNRVCYL